MAHNVYSTPIAMAHVLWQSVSHDSDGGRRVPSSLILSLMLNLRLLSTVRGRQQLWSPWQPQKQHYHRGPQVTTNYTPRWIISSRTRSSNRVLAWISAVLHVCVVLTPPSLSLLTPPSLSLHTPPLSHHTTSSPSHHPLPNTHPTFVVYSLPPLYPFSLPFFLPPLLSLTHVVVVFLLSFFLKLFHIHRGS